MWRSSRRMAFLAASSSRAMCSSARPSRPCALIASHCSRLRYAQLCSHAATASASQSTASPRAAPGGGKADACASDRVGGCACGGGGGGGGGGCAAPGVSATADPSFEAALKRARAVRPPSTAACSTSARDWFSAACGGGLGGLCASPSAASAPAERAAPGATPPLIGARAAAAASVPESARILGTEWSPRVPSSATSLTSSDASRLRACAEKSNQSLVPSIAPSQPSGTHPSHSITGTTSCLSLYAYSASVRHAWDSLYSRETQTSTTAAFSTARAMASRHEPRMSRSSIHVAYPADCSCRRMRCACAFCAWQYEIITCRHLLPRLARALPPPAAERGSAVPLFRSLCGTSARHLPSVAAGPSSANSRVPRRPSALSLIEADAAASAIAWLSSALPRTAMQSSEAARALLPQRVCPPAPGRRSTSALRSVLSSAPTTRLLHVLARCGGGHVAVYSASGGAWRIGVLSGRPGDGADDGRAH
mmetsp:Transcript_7835/g.20049  ORF Transcript_7835/g.20049 Transcript_7835/m.20049 type:complete len:481 (-) Transcript_7835:830-2272(-)